MPAKKLVWVLLAGAAAAALAVTLASTAVLSGGSKQASAASARLASASRTKPGFRDTLFPKQMQPGEQRYVGVGADILPPPKTVLFAVPASRALATINSRDVRKGLRTGAPSVRLAVYENRLGQENADGTMIPSVPPTLAWIFTWYNSPPLVIGPVGFDRAKLAHLKCIYVEAVSANTGKILDAFQSCGP
jgi:hypothetical protein